MRHIILLPLEKINHTFTKNNFIIFIREKMQQMMCGGTTGMQSPDDEANQVLASVKDQLHEKAGTSGEGEIKKDQYNYKLKINITIKII